MIKKNYFFIFLFLTFLSYTFAESTSTSITNTSFYKLKNDESLHNSNDVSANLKLVKLSTTITSDRKIVRIGEITGFKISLNNFYTESAKNIEVFVNIPQGFQYIENSAYIKDNEIIKTINKNRGVSFFLKKDLEKNKALELFFSVKVNMTVRPGENYFSTVSQGNIESGGVISSNTNTTKIFVDQEENKRRGVVFGLVFVDLNNNKIYDKDEPTVPNIKIYLENGHFAITDGSGKYSIFGERALTHVVRLDELSAPKNGKLIKIDNRYSNDGTSVFADVKRNELYKVNFAFSNTDQPFLKEVKDRKNLSKALPSEIEDVIELNQNIRYLNILYYMCTYFFNCTSEFVHNKGKINIVAYHLKI